MKKYTNLEEKQVAEEYINGASSSELCKKYGFKTGKSILDKVRKYYGNDFVRSQRESLMMNKSYSKFTIEKIDSKFNAYFIGLLSADGCIHKNKNCVELSMTDEDVIKFVSVNIQKPYYKYVRNGNRKNIYRITINNKVFLEDLKRFNIVERKTHILDGFSIYDEEIKYIPYYIRGCIDGDGWIRKDGKEFFICTASLQYANWLKKILEKYLYMDDINIIKADKVYQIRTALNRNINILKAVVYDVPYGMERKYKLLHG